MKFFITIKGVAVNGSIEFNSIDSKHANSLARSIVSNFYAHGRDVTYTLSEVVDEQESILEPKPLDEKTFAMAWEGEFLLDEEH